MMSLKPLRGRTIGAFGFPVTLLGALLIVSCRDSSSALGPPRVMTPALSATSEWLEFPIAVDWTAYAQCLAEDMHGIGTVTLRGHWVTTSRETRQFLFDHVNGDDAWNFHLEGLTTGHVWLATPGNRDMQLSTASGDFFQWTQRFVYQNQATGAVVDWPLRITFVVNANGEIKVDRALPADSCRVRH